MSYSLGLQVGEAAAGAAVARGAQIDLRALPAHRVLDGTTRDRATAVTSNLDDEARDDGRFFL